MTTKRPITRERAKGIDEKAGLFDEGSKVWLWNIDTGGRDLELADLMKKWDDFQPGYAEGIWYVDGVDVAENGSGTDFLTVTQSWRRVETANPLLKPFRWTGMESMEIQIPAWMDADRKLCVTTAGEPLVGMTRVQRIWRFTGEKNIPGIPAWLAEYGRSTNADTVRIGTVAIKPNCLQLQSVRIGDEDSSTKVAGRTIIFRPLQVEVWWNPFTWTTEVLNAGLYELRRLNLRELKKAVYVPVRISNNGDNVDSPQFLDKNGFRPRDEAGNPKALIGPEDIHILRFNFDDRLPYAKLFR